MSQEEIISRLENSKRKFPTKFYDRIRSISNEYSVDALKKFETQKKLSFEDFMAKKFTDELSEISTALDVFKKAKDEDDHQKLIELMTPIYKPAICKALEKKFNFPSLKKEDLEDIAQEIFLDLWRKKIKTELPKGEFRWYLRGALKKKLLELCRKYKKQPLIFCEDLDEHSKINECFETEVTKGVDEVLTQEIDNIEKKSYRDVARLCWIEGYSAKKICEELEIPKSTYYFRRNKGIEKLKKTLPAKLADVINGEI